MSKVDNAVLNSLISKEIAMTDYIFNHVDKNILREMLSEINSLGYNLNYLAELDSFHVPGSGEIIAKYIRRFISESTRAYLVPQLVIEKVEDCDKLVLELYNHFKASEEYITGKGKPSSAHIYVRYDNAFHKLKSRRIKNELCQIVQNPRDMHYLPYTTRMLASWKLPELKSIFVRYLRGETLSPTEVGLSDDCDGYFPPLRFINRDLLFTAIDCSRYYMDDELLSLLERYLNCNDKDIKVAANQILKKIS